MLRTWEAMLSEARKETHSRLQQRVQLQRQLIHKMSEYQTLKNSAMVEEELTVRHREYVHICAECTTCYFFPCRGRQRRKLLRKKCWHDWILFKDWLASLHHSLAIEYIHPFEYLLYSVSIRLFVCVCIGIGRIRRNPNKVETDLKEPQTSPQTSSSGPYEPSFNDPVSAAAITPAATSLASSKSTQPKSHESRHHIFGYLGGDRST